MQDLRTVRETKRLTQQGLSKLVGLSQPHLASIESGKLLPQKKTRIRIEGILGKTIDWQQTISYDRENVTRQMIELLNIQAEGVLERVGHVKRIVNEIEKTLKTYENESTYSNSAGA